MSMWELVLIAVSLAMEAFAVSVAKGHCFTGQDSVKKLECRSCLVYSRWLCHLSVGLLGHS